MRTLSAERLRLQGSVALEGMGDMYSSEQRTRAVELFFSGGLSMQEVVDQLGYPTRSSLGRWVREDPRYDPATASRAPYAQDVRVQAAEMMRAGVPAADVARELGIGSIASVYNWARDYGRGGAEALAVHTAPTAAVHAEVAELRERCQALERENAVLREVLDAMISGGSGARLSEQPLAELPNLNTPEAEFGSGLLDR